MCGQHQGQRHAPNPESCCVSGVIAAPAGVQYGQRCLCGNACGRFGVTTNCNMSCTGDSRQICGGGNANGVYQLR